MESGMKENLAWIKHRLIFIMDLGHRNMERWSLYGYNSSEKTGIQMVTFYISVITGKAQYMLLVWEVY